VAYARNHGSAQWRAGNLAAWEDRVPIQIRPGGYDIDELLREPSASA